MTLTQKTRPLVDRKLRILIVDDHEVARRGLRTRLQAERGWDVCGEAQPGDEAIDKARNLRPDVVVIETHLPGVDGTHVARQILSKIPRAEVLL